MIGGAMILGCTGKIERGGSKERETQIGRKSFPL